MFRMGPFWNEGISTVSFHELSTTCTMYIAMFRLSLTTFFRFNNTEDDFSAKLRQPLGQRLCNVRMQQKKIIGPVLFSYYEESLVSSNLNSKLSTIYISLYPCNSLRIQPNQFSNNFSYMYHHQHPFNLHSSCYFEEATYQLAAWNWLP